MPGTTSAEPPSQQLLQPIRRCALPQDRRQTNDPIVIGQQVQFIRVRLLWPTIPKQPTHRYLQRLGRRLRTPFEQPLRRIIRPWLR